MGARQTPFEDKVSKLNYISQDPLVKPVIHIRWLNVVYQWDDEVCVVHCQWLNVIYHWDVEVSIVHCPSLKKLFLNFFPSWLINNLIKCAPNIVRAH